MKAVDNLRKIGILVGVMLGCGTTFASASDVNVVSSVPVKVIPLLPDGSAPDYSRKDTVSALINYEAASRMQDYQLNQELLFMAAPGSIYAMNAGAIVGASNSSAMATQVSDNSLVYSLGPYSLAQKISLHGTQYPVVSPAAGPVQVYELFKDFLASGDSTNLPFVNISSVLQLDNLTKKDSGITTTQAQGLVNMIANPFPQIDSGILARLKANQLTGSDMEALGGKIASYAIVGVSVSALSDIIARRVPSNGQAKSVMEVMDDHSQERIKNPDWYNQIGSASEAALMREMVHMMAYNQWMAYEQFRVSEQQLALMASMNAVMAKMNAGLIQLSGQMAAAQMQGQAAQQQLQFQLNQQGHTGTVTGPGGTFTGGYTGNGGGYLTAPAP